MLPLEQISEDLGWRESELGSLKILLNRRDVSAAQKEVLLRASWAMLYAHYEGFVKTSLTIFYDEARKRVRKSSLLPMETRLNALDKVLRKMRSLSKQDLLSNINNFNVEVNEAKPDFPEVNTNSNLWPNILFDLLLMADINSSKIKIHRHSLKTLVSRRNEIAHGKRDIISEVRYYLEHEAVVSDVMYEIAIGIDERLNAPPYV